MESMDGYCLHFIDTDAYLYCYRYYLVQNVWKVVENVKFCYSWILANVCKVLPSEAGSYFSHGVLFYFINVKGIVHP